MALPDDTTQDGNTYKANINTTAADHDSRIATLEGNNTPELGFIPTTSGSIVDIDLAVPTWVNEIVFSVNDQRMSGGGNFELLLGTVAAWEVTGYISTLRIGTTTSSVSTLSTAFLYATGAVSGNAHSGHLRLTRANTASNDWIFTSQVTIDFQNRIYHGVGRKTLASNLGRIRVQTTNLFTQGGIGYKYLP